MKHNMSYKGLILIFVANGLKGSRDALCMVPIKCIALGFTHYTHYES